MNGNCHFIFGAAVAASAAIVTGADQNTTTLLLATGLIGSVFPDIDNPKSHFGQLTKPVSTLIGQAGKITGHTGKRHRGLFHDLGLYMLLAIASYNFVPALIGFFLGILSHLILDAMNPAGIKIFTKYFSIGKVPSDSKLAVCISWGLVIATIGAACIFRYLYGTLNFDPNYINKFQFH